jgi:hypothetical protein
MIHPLTFFGAGWLVFEVESALVDVADQEVGASWVAQVADLAQQVRHRDLRVLEQSAPEMISVGIHQGGPVPGWALELPGGLGPGISFDCVQGPALAPGALEQASTLGEEVVNRLVSRGGALVDGPRCFGLGRNGFENGSGAGSEATGVGDDGFLDRLAEAVPQVPAVTDLDGV